jgi:Plant transposon protein
MLGGIDCTNWQWKNCPVAFHGQYSGKEGVPTVTLETIADQNLWLWYVFFGVPGAANDINVLETLLFVTRTRVPYIASTTLDHRNVVNSNALSFYPHSSLSKHSDQTSLTA